MNGGTGFLRGYLSTSPTSVRVLPFLIFVVLTFCQGQWGPDSAFFFYAAKTFIGAGLLWLIWPYVPEMRWRCNWEAIGVGVGICVMWIGIDPFYPHLGGAGGMPWNPFARFGSDNVLAWSLFAVRLVGSTLIVPPMEELFYRSFLYRYLQHAEFLKQPLAFLGWRAFWVSAIVFGFAHREWLAGILCGGAYLWLVIRHGSLGYAMMAHAITNFLLGLWVYWRGAWNFW